MNLIEAIKNWGLNEKEAKVYLALLHLGLTTAYNVSNKSGLKKPTTYVILDQLQEKGMVRKIPRAKKLLFKAESPQYIWQIVEERMLWAKRALPELLAIKKEKDKKVSVAYYEGIVSLRKLYYKLVKEAGRETEILAFYAQLEDSPNALVDFLKELNEFQEKKGTKRRIISTEHSFYQENSFVSAMIADQRLKIKTLFKDKYDSTISIEIYEKKVLLVSHRYLQGIVIDNPDIANAIRQIFEMVWSLVEKDRKSYLSHSNMEK